MQLIFATVMSALAASGVEASSCTHYNLSFPIADTGELRDHAFSGGNFVGGNLYPALWQFFRDELGVRSVLDVACGLGESTRTFRSLGMYPVFAFDAKLSNVARSDEAVAHGSDPAAQGNVIGHPKCTRT